MQYRSYFVNRTSNGVAVGPTITRRRNGRGCLSPLAENGMRYRVDNAKSPSYEFEVSTDERSDDDNARSVCKGEGKVPRALSVTHSRATSTTHFAFTSLPRRLRPSSSSSRRPRSNDDFIFATPPLLRADRWSQDSVRYALFSPGYSYRLFSRMRGDARRYVWCVRQTNPLDVLSRAHSPFRYTGCPFPLNNFLSIRFKFS